MTSSPAAWSSSWTGALARGQPGILGEGAWHPAVPEGLVVGITGATGHVGSVLLKALLSSPAVAEVRSVARRPLPAAQEAGGPRVAHLEADLRSVDARRWLQGSDLLFHLGAAVWRGRGQAALASMYQTNVEGTGNVLASRPGAAVIASSIVVYGAWPENAVPLDELCQPRPNPQCSYAAQKLASEHVALGDGGPGRRAVGRLSAVIGPNADSRVLAGVRAFRWAVPAITGRSQALQWLHEDDAVAGLLCIGEALVTGAPGVAGEVFNLCPSDWLSELDLARLAGSRVLRLPRPVVFAGAELARWSTLSPFGVDRAVFLDGPMAASPEKAGHRLRWQARTTSAAALQAALNERWPGRKDNRRPQPKRVGGFKGPTQRGAAPGSQSEVW